MQKPTKTDLVQREDVMDLLSDEETSKVTTAETKVRLDEGDEYVDLEKLAEGVKRADGAVVHMATVLPKKSVHEATWSKIVALLGSPKVSSPKQKHVSSKS